MTIPPTVKIGHLTYRVITDGEPTVHEQANIFGLANHDKQIISLSGDMSQARQAETFLHELIHCAINFTGSSFEWKDKSYSEEDVCQMLGATLYMIIKDNGLDFT